VNSKKLLWTHSKKARSSHAIGCGIHSTISKKEPSLSRNSVATRRDNSALASAKSCLVKDDGRHYPSNALCPNGRQPGPQSDHFSELADLLAPNYALGTSCAKSPLVKVSILSVFGTSEQILNK
jgi:hypothetical protein